MAEINPRFENGDKDKPMCYPKDCRASELRTNYPYCTLTNYSVVEPSDVERPSGCIPALRQRIAATEVLLADCQKAHDATREDWLESIARAEKAEAELAALKKENEQLGDALELEQSAHKLSVDSFHKIRERDWGMSMSDKALSTIESNVEGRKEAVARAEKAEAELEQVLGITDADIQNALEIGQQEAAEFEYATGMSTVPPINWKAYAEKAEAKIKEVREWWRNYGEELASDGTTIYHEPDPEEMDELNVILAEKEDSLAANTVNKEIEIERDAARRELCVELAPSLDLYPFEYAQIRKWEYLYPKEDTNA